MPPTRRNPAFFDIYTLDVTRRMPRRERVYQQDGSNNVAAWAPDGTALIVAQHREAGQPRTSIWCRSTAARPAC